jgi:5-methylthioribose kinase
LEGNDGGCNFILLLKDANLKTILVKWSSPFVRQFMSGYPLDQTRCIYEREFLILSNTLYPNAIPKVYFSSSTNFYTGMEYLVGYSNFKTELIRGNKNDLVAQKIGEYMAIKSFKTSNLFLKSTEMAKNTMKFIGNTNPRTLCDFLNFKLYYDENNLKNHPEAIAKVLKTIQASEVIMTKVGEWELEMLENVQCVLHGDFHTGGVLVREDKIYIIDAEAATMGPMAYDIGLMFGNLIHAYGFQNAFEKVPGDRKEYKKWILQVMCDMWNVFETKFNELWVEKKTKLKKDYLKRIFKSTIGYCAVTVLRGAVEPWPEYQHVKGDDKKETIRLNLLGIAKTCLETDFDNIEAVSKVINESNA